MNPFPTNTDVLFKEEVDTIHGAWIQNPTDKFFLYSEGYKQGAEALYDKYVNDPFYGQWLVYPLIFNYRQYIELRLKELITMGYKYLGVEGDFKDIHSLKPLWDTYRNDILPGIHEVEDDILNNVERIIYEFHDVDPGSFSFRYPVTKGPYRKPTLSMRTIDLKNFKVTLDKLSLFFEYQWDTISNYQDLKNDYISDMMSQMYYENGYY